MLESGVDVATLGNHYLAKKEILDYIDDYDELHRDFEERFKIVGLVEKVLVVIYTERGDRNRIISARLADKYEEAEYYEQFRY